MIVRNDIDKVILSRIISVHWDPSVISSAQIKQMSEFLAYMSRGFSFGNRVAVT